MGLTQSTDDKIDQFERPSEKHVATLYYFAGRGLADQIRWMLAAANISFTQKSITSREKFLQMAEGQLPFGQVPLLQIDGLEIVQSQAAIRYLAKRSSLIGKTAKDELKCDVIAESVKDLLRLVLDMPFKRYGKNASKDQLDEHVKLMKEKWRFYGSRFENILKANNKEYLVGSSLTYADILVAHVTTWFVEELGPDILVGMPCLVDLQVKVISLPGINNFIKSIQYFPVGNEAYVQQVGIVLGREI